MVNSLDEFYVRATPFIGRFDAFVKRLDLVDGTRPDHICYKCDSSDSFERLRKLFESESTYIYQTIISGRRIAYIKMERTITTASGPIAFLELSDQKPDGSQRDDFDHIEVYPIAFSYEEMVQRLSKTEKVTTVTRPHHTTDDIDIGEGFLFRCTREPLIEKISREILL